MPGTMHTKLELLDKQKFLDVAKIISWLDDKRWLLPENYALLNYFADNLTNAEKILTHWICYITDRQIPFETVWDKGSFVFSELAFTFSRTSMPTSELLARLYEEYRDREGKIKFRFKSVTFKNNKPVYFASRYFTKDFESIKQTLQILEKGYDKSIIRFVLSFMKRFEGEGDLLIRIACALNLLTYKTNNVDNIVETLKDNTRFEQELVSFKKTSTYNKKRLWCCVRDYKKGGFSIILKEAIRETASNDKAQKTINIWEKLPMEQMELPGDVWNNNPTFKEKLFGNLINIDKIPKTWQMPKITRKMYEQIKGQIKEKDITFYPEQFDITFDFVPRMCNKKLCNVCPFGKDGSKLICIPNREKFCPVALVTCGYTIRCIGVENCIAYSNTGRGVCTTLM